MFGTPIDEDIPSIERDEAALEVLDRNAGTKRDEALGKGGIGKGLGRAGDRSLYCVVKMKGKGWRFPGGEMEIVKELEGKNFVQAPIHEVCPFFFLSYSLLLLFFLFFFGGRRGKGEGGVNSIIYRWFFFLSFLLCSSSSRHSIRLT